MGHSGWLDVLTPDPAMSTTNGGLTWSYTYALPAGADAINVVFNDGSTWDNNSGLNWNVAVLNCQPPFDPEVLYGQGRPARRDRLGNKPERSRG